MRGVLPGACDILPATGALGATLTDLAVAFAGAGSRIRRGPQAAGHRGALRGSRRAVGLASEGRGEAAAPQRRDPRLNPGRLRRVTLAALSPWVVRVPSSQLTAGAVRPGAPKVRP